MKNSQTYSLWDKDPPSSNGTHAANGTLYPQNNETYHTNGEVKENGLTNGELKTDDVSQEPEQERGQWGNKAEFILSCIGLSVGLGNVWRFPYLAYEHGGAAFVIAYLILQILIGKPMYFMELVIGQYSGKGPTGVWNMNPSAKGVGIAMALIALVVAIYYNVVMAYTLYYFFSSMQTTLPWTVCKEEWLPLGCVEQTVKQIAFCTGNITMDLIGNDTCRCTGNVTLDELPFNYNCTTLPYNGSAVTAAELFFYKEVIQKSDGLEPDNMGLPLWRLTLCLLLSWVVVVLCLIKGVKSSGKVVYFTATFPYVILLILLVRGATLPGALVGVEYFIIPKWEKLLDLNVWVAAAGQMFFSLSVSFGGIIMFGSYNKFKNNVYWDALLISVMDLVTSIIAGLVIFTTFGYMSVKAGVDIDLVAKKGYGLAFVAYPEALSQLAPSQLWSVLFFFMLFTLGLDSEFALLETVLTCIQDEFPKLRKYKSYMCVGIGVICFLLALPCVTPAGDYIVNIMDHYGADFSVLFVATCECIAIMWVYGVRRFVKDVTYMLGSPPRPLFYWVFCWVFAAPVLIGLLFIYRMVKYQAPEYSEGVLFPSYAQGLGWLLTGLIMSPIPVVFIWMFLRAKGSILERLRTIISPTAEWGPADGSERVQLNSEFPMQENKFGIDNPGSLPY